LENWTASGNLLMVGFIKPHHPFDPPEPWDLMYNPDEMELLPGWLGAVPERDRSYHSGFFPNHQLTEVTLRRITAFYYASISQIDHQIGRMIDLLRYKGLYDDTVIVFTSDHGEYLGFHHMILKGCYLYEPLVRVPLIVKFPGSPDAGSIRDTLVSGIDLAPTLIHQAGVEPPPDMQGLNLADERADRPLVFAQDHRQPMYMARSHTHKLLMAREPAQSLLFDLQKDPLELVDRSDDLALGPLLRQHRDAIVDLLMFDALPPDYRDEQTALIQQANVADPQGDHRQQMLTYLERQMDAYLSSEAPLDASGNSVNN
jgi:arylsulfatase A-like enzyme